MPQGLQAWDANGNLIVDIGDYSTRFVGSYDLNMPINSTAINIALPGVSSETHFAVIVKANDGSINAALLATSLTAIIGTNVLWLVSLVGGQVWNRPVTVDVYAYS